MIFTPLFLKLRDFKKRDELKIKERQSNKIGVISWLTQEDEGLTVEESNKNLKEKIESLKNQITGYFAIFCVCEGGCFVCERNSVIC